MQTVNSTPPVVTAKPIVMGRVALVLAAIVLAAFVVTALLMSSHNGGARFVENDRIATLVIGVVLAGLLIMPTRPRLRADAEGVHVRGFLGGWRHVPWNLIVRVDFPSRVRFARLVLPAEESLAIYAVTRWDKQQAVSAMRALRALHAEHSPYHVHS